MILRLTVLVFTTINALDILPCDKSLIQGAKSSEFEYKSNKLRCLNDKDIAISDEHYHLLTCDAKVGWKFGKEIIKPVINPTDVLNVSCVTKACDVSLISGFDNKTMHFNTHDLQCRDRNKVLKLPAGNTTESVACMPLGTWLLTDERKVKISSRIKGVAPFAVLGCEYPACHEKGIKWEKGVKMSIGIKTLDLFCEAGLELIVDDVTYDKLKCNKKGWTDGISTEIIRKASDEFAVKCEPIPCQTSLPSADVSFDQGNLKCAPVDGTLRALKLSGNHTLYDQLMCDGTSWMVNENKTIQSAKIILEATCEEFCLYNDVGAATQKVQKEIENSTVSLDCEDQSHAVWNNVDNKVGDIDCSFENYWMRENQKLTMNNTHPIDVKCIKVCEFEPNNDLTVGSNGLITCTSDKQQLKINTTYYSSLLCHKREGWTDGVILLEGLDLMKRQKIECETIKLCESEKISDKVEKLEKEHNTIYRCKNRKIGSVDNSILFNGTQVLSDLQCDPTHGWSDMEGKKLGESNIRPELACGDSPCKKLTLHNCSDFSRTLPEGYKCTTTPFELEIESNRLHCEDHQILYSAQYSFLVEVPRCMENGKWSYGIDRDERVYVNETHDKLVCIQRICGRCKPLGRLEKSSHLEDYKFTAGDNNKCAEAECPNNIWQIDSTDYAGTVICSPDLPNEGQWVMDNGTVISSAKVACPQTVKCTETARLESNCSGWRSERQCEKVELSNEEPVKCPEGKLLFYKNANESEYKPVGDKIVCNENKGYWKVSPDESEVIQLPRGGNIVCAKTVSEPATKAPRGDALKKAGIPPCKLCKSYDEMLLLCSECSIEEADTHFIDLGDQCIATSVKTSKFSTDIGVVEGKLVCKRNGKVWKKGSRVISKFAAYEEDPNEVANADFLKALYIAGGIAAGVLLAIIVAVIVRCCRNRREDAEDAETERQRLLDEERRKKYHIGDNDSILEEADDQFTPPDLRL